MWLALQALGINKWIMYGTVALLLVTVVGTVYLTIKKSGADQERTKQLQDALKNLSQEVRHRQAIEAMKTSEARSKLKQRWSKR